MLLEQKLTCRPHIRLEPIFIDSLEELLQWPLFTFKAREIDKILKLQVLLKGL